MKQQFITPSALGILLLLCFLLLLSTSMRGTSMSTVAPPSAGGPGVTEMSYTYGLPTMLRIDTQGPTEDAQRRTDVQVYWGTIAAMLAIGWSLAMPIGRWVSGYVRRDGEFAGPLHTGWSHPAAIVGYVLTASAVVAAIAGVVFQRTFGSGVTLAEVIFGFFMLLLIFGVPATLLVMVVRRWRHRGRVTQRGFAVEMVAAQV